MNRGRRRERVYDDDADYLGFVALLREAAGLWDIGIGAFCLMANDYQRLRACQVPQGAIQRTTRGGNSPDPHNAKRQFRRYRFHLRPQEL